MHRLLPPNFCIPFFIFVAWFFLFSFLLPSLSWNIMSSTVLSLRVREGGFYNNIVPKYVVAL